jgi:hypothetical protein
VEANTEVLKNLEKYDIIAGSILVSEIREYISVSLFIVWKYQMTPSIPVFLASIF